ncbi:MAG: protein translocase subunit SecDF [Prevotella sp.]|nr:protein translocase subunit SecDF [Prevotella sp.]
MQNKGIVKFIAVALVLVCCFYLSFSFVTSHYENKIEQVRAEKGEEAALLLQDSLETNKVWLWTWNLKECREMEMGLGLDLKGGLNVIMEVSVPDIVDMLAAHKQDADYRKVFDDARKKVLEAGEGDFVDIFCDMWEDQFPNRKLREIFATSQLRDKVTSQSENNEVRNVLHEEVTSAIDNAENVVRNRVDKFGVVQPNIQRLEGQSRIMVELPGVKDETRYLKMLASSANLEFWETYSCEEVNGNIQRLMSDYAALMNDKGTPAQTDSTDVAAATDSLAKDSTAVNTDLAARLGGQTAAQDGEYKLPRLILYPQGNAVVGHASRHDTAAVNRILQSEMGQRMQRENKLKLLWAAKADGPIMEGETGEQFRLYAIKVTDPQGKPAMSGDVIVSASDGYDQMGKPDVSMQMDSKGTREWARLTRENINKSIAIVLDDVVYSAPNVNSEIDGGNSQITGNFTIEDTKDLANTLNSGKMPAPMSILSHQMVGPSLGAKSIQQGIISFIVAFILLMIVMVLLYNFIPGMLANCALLLNLFFTLGILASFQAALTMPGIAGIVLTLGTAVDANVLIYERIKEELKKGLHMREAVDAGYSNAFSAIFDANLTSLITGVILYVFGTGPIRGFATTLIIGICISFFTAVFMTRLVYDRQIKKDKWQDLTFSTNFSKNLMQNTKFNIMGQFKKSYTIWAIAAVLFCVSFAVRGLSRSIDFTGGRNYQVKLEKNVPVEDVRKALEGAFVNTSGSNEGQVANTSVIALEGENNVRISTNWNYENNDPTIDEQAKDILYEKLQAAGLVTEATPEQFKAPAANGVDKDSKVGRIDSEMKVGPSIAKTITRAAFISVLLALIAIFLYILLRFRNVAFSVGSIVALAFDALIVIGFFSVLWGWVPMSLEVDQTFIGAILTVIGYSINDKVVVFDRIRENLGLYPKHDKKQLFNDSINQTLARTINTSVTTLIVLLTIFILGGDSIRPFSFAMILGVIFGTLSSIFIAAPTAYLILNRKHNKQSEKEEAAK